MIPHNPVQYRFIRLSGFVLRSWNVRRRTLVWAGALADERSMHVWAQSTHRAQQTKTWNSMTFIRRLPRHSTAAAGRTLIWTGALADELSLPKM